MISTCYPKEHILNKANNCAVFLGLELSQNYGKSHLKKYTKRGEYNFIIVNWPHREWDVPRSTSYDAVHLSANSFWQSMSFCRGFQIKSLLKRCWNRNTYSTGHYQIDEISGSGAVRLQFRYIHFQSLFHHYFRYLRMLYIVFSLMRRRATRRLTRLQNMYNFLKYRKIL